MVESLPAIPQRANGIANTCCGSATGCSLCLSHSLTAHSGNATGTILDREDLRRRAYNASFKAFNVQQGIPHSTTTPHHTTPHHAASLHTLLTLSCPCAKQSGQYGEHAPLLVWLLGAGVAMQHWQLIHLHPWLLLTVCLKDSSTRKALRTLPTAVLTTRAAEQCPLSALLLQPAGIATMP